MTETRSDSTTVALVHGAFADSGSWAPVAGLLLEAGVKVQALSVPLRGLISDSAYVASAISQIPGRVLAVGHSYGGAVITNAASTTTNVVGLVFVNAFAPEKDETLNDVEGNSRDSALGSAIVPVQFPGGAGESTSTELYVNPASFYEVFARDLPEGQAAVLGASQRPIAASAFDEKSGDPAWKKLHSWAVIATGDKAAGADVLRTMAQRAGAETLEIDGSHLVMMSQPEAVTDVILKALASVG